MQRKPNYRKRKLHNRLIRNRKIRNRNLRIRSIRNRKNRKRDLRRSSIQGRNVRRSSIQRRNVRSRSASEKYRRRRRRRTIQLYSRIASVAAVFLLVLLGVPQIIPVYAAVRMEAGTDADISEFLRFSWMKAEYANGSENFDKNVPGTYRLKIKAGLLSHTCSLTIEDTTPPTLEVKDLVVGREGAPKASDFVASVEDVTETAIEYVNEPNLSLVGTSQEVGIRAVDTSGNKTERTANLTVLPIRYRVEMEAGGPVPDIYSFVLDTEVDEEETYIISDVESIDYSVPGETDIEVMYQGTVYPAKICIMDDQAPVFSLAENFTSFLGESIKYKQHVTVTDNSGAVDLEIDTSQVDVNKEGSYKVNYKAKDAAGNTAEASATITIVKKTVNEEELYNRVDAILAEILNDSMSQREKALEIFAYIRNNYVFVDFSDKSDYAKAALDMMNSAQGDCYSYFAIAKAMLTRAGIKNMDIETHTDTQEHYWNLVDIDDGHGWYHFDSSPHILPVAVFLYTTEDLQEANDGRYDFDATKYPVIP